MTNGHIFRDHKPQQSCRPNGALAEDPNMALKLLPPGARKGNKCWVAYGRQDGRVIEKSTGETTKTAAQAWLRRYLKGEAPVQQSLPLEAPAPRAPAEKTLTEAIAAYAIARGLDLDCGTTDGERQDIRRLKRLDLALGGRPLSSVCLDDLVALANRSYASGAPATKNREVLRPAAAVLHYAAANRWCNHWPVKLFKEPAPGVRAVSHDAEAALLAAAKPGEERLLMLWLFRTGMRIEDTLLRVVWPGTENGGERTGIDLDAGIVRFRAGKTDEYKELALADDLIEALHEVPVDQRRGRVFRWRHQSTLTRDVLKRLRRETGVHFTPHMARHTLGARLNEAGAGLRTIMAALGHADVKSSIRYQSADIELVRATINKLQRRA